MKAGGERVAELDHTATHLHFLGVLDLDIFGDLNNGLLFIEGKLCLVFRIVGWISLLVKCEEILMFENPLILGMIYCEAVGRFFGLYDNIN